MSDKTKNRVWTCLILALAGVGVAGLLVVGSCATLYFWFSRDAEVEREAIGLTGEEAAFASVYLEPDDEAIAELTIRIIERLRELQRDRGGNPFAFFQPQPDQQAQQQLRQVLPARLDLRLFPAGGDDPTAPFVAELTLSQNWRQYHVMFRVLHWTVGRSNDRDVRAETWNERDILVIARDRAPRQILVANVDNHFLVSSSRTRLEAVLELTEAPDSELPPPTDLLERLNRPAAPLRAFWTEPVSWIREPRHGEGALVAWFLGPDRVGWELAARFEDAQLARAAGPSLAREIERRLEELVISSEIEVASTVARIEGPIVVASGELTGLLEALEAGLARLQREPSEPARLR